MIRVQNKWWSDPRRFVLIQLCQGEELKADGMALHLWSFGLKFYLQDKRLIPTSFFHALACASEIVGAELVELKEEGVRVKGSDAFEWNLKIKEAGRKGGLIKAKKKQRSLARLKPGLSQAKTQVLKIEKSSHNYEFIAAYVTAFQSRYGTNTRPNLNGKVQGQVKKFLEDTPIERAIQLIQVYLQLETPWFKTKGHDFSTFLENLNPISIALDRGEQMGNVVDWEQIFNP